MKIKFRSLLLYILIGFGLMLGCTADLEDLVGPSTGGNVLGISAFFGLNGIIADGSSQATIRVELFNSFGQAVDAASVTLTTTLGTLGANTLTTTNGVATTTLTSGTVPGTAFVVATFENISATTAVPIIKF